MSSTANASTIAAPEYRVVCTVCEFTENMVQKESAERAARHHEHHGVGHYCDVRFIGEGEEPTRVKTSNTYGVRDPWRFECPECDGPRSRIHKRTGDMHAVSYAGDPNAPLYCNDCGTALYTLYDKKEDCEVQYGSRDVASGDARSGTSL